ncbi:ANTAR domain-containing protein [Streptomyces sp. Ac-502]|uniref:ANTAR domain-containing protein n=1 Tax=Streptomyces sp. Ac-502 TaxID=3342801 RepID=UPI0038622BCC
MGAYAAEGGVGVGGVAGSEEPFGLFDDGAVVQGVLNLFRRTPGPLPAEDRDTARALADATAISLLLQSALDEHRTVRAQLEKALDTRTIIEQAKGFLTARHETDPDTAFHHLRAHARHHHLRLVDLARDIVNSTTTLPPPDTDKTPTP